MKTALGYAHRQNMMHRDIKPVTILQHDGSVLVADFRIVVAMQKAVGFAALVTTVDAAIRTSSRRCASGRCRITCTACSRCTIPSRKRELIGGRP